MRRADARKPTRQLFSRFSLMNKYFFIIRHNLSTYLNSQTRFCIQIWVSFTHKHTQVALLEFYDNFVLTSRRQNKFIKLVQFIPWMVNVFSLQLEFLIFNEIISQRRMKVEIFSEKTRGLSALKYFPDCTDFRRFSSLKSLHNCSSQLLCFGCLLEFSINIFISFAINRMELNSLELVTIMNGVRLYFQL